MDISQKTSLESYLPKISKPANRELHNAGFYRLEQLSKVTESDILKIHGVGPKAVIILNDALKEKGLSFAFKQGENGAINSNAHLSVITQ